MSKRWSLWRAVLYGLLLMLFVFAVHILGIWAGTTPPDPWLSSAVPIHILLAHWIAYLMPGPILFVIVAAIRNMFVRKPTKLTFRGSCPMIVQTARKKPPRRRMARCR
jgi:hypothetical protein